MTQTNYELLNSTERRASYRRMLGWYLGLTLAGLAIAGIAWALMPLLGIAGAIALLAALTMALSFTFAYLSRSWLAVMKHYPRTGPFAVAVSVPLIIFMILVSSGVGLLIPALFVAPFLFRSILAGSTYFTRLLDLHNANIQYQQTNDVKDQAQATETKLDFYAMLMGTLLGVLVMALSVVSGNIAHIGTMDFLAHGFALAAGIGSFGGLFNRPVARQRMASEQWAMRLVFIAAIVTAVLLCSFSLVPAIAATGLMTAGIAGIPFYFFFVPSFVGACVSFADYVLKTAVYTLKLLGNETCHQYLTDKHKEHEYRGSAIGMLIGVALGIALVVLMITQPHIFTTLLIAKSLGGKIMLGFLMAGAVSGAGSRIGKTFDDKPAAALVDLVKSAGQENYLLPTSTPTETPTDTVVSTPSITGKNTSEQNQSPSYQKINNQLSPTPSENEFAQVEQSKKEKQTDQSCFGIVSAWFASLSPTDPTPESPAGAKTAITTNKYAPLPDPI